MGKPETFIQISTEGKVRLEVKRCDNNRNAAHLICRTWLHFNSGDLMDLIANLELVLSNIREEGEHFCDMCGLKRDQKSLYHIVIRPRTLERHMNICFWCVGSIEQGVRDKQGGEHQ